MQLHTDGKTAKVIGFQGGIAFVYSSSTNKAKKLTDTSEAMHHTNTDTKQKMDKKKSNQRESLNTDDNVLVESATGKFKEVHGATAKVLNQDMSAWLRQKGHQTLWF